MRPSIRSRTPGASLAVPGPTELLTMDDACDTSAVTSVTNVTYPALI